MFFKYLFTHCIMMKSQSKKQLQKSITDHAKQFLKICRRFIRNALKNEICAYLQNKK